MRYCHARAATVPARFPADLACGWLSIEEPAGSFGSHPASTLPEEKTRASARTARRPFPPATEVACGVRPGYLSWRGIDGSANSMADGASGFIPEPRRRGPDPDQSQKGIYGTPHDAGPRPGRNDGAAPAAQEIDVGFLLAASSTVGKAAPPKPLKEYPV